MILGIWKNITFYCDNHEEPIKFTVKQSARQGTTAFYGCPKYFKKDENFPDGWDEEYHERACPNRLNFDDAQDIVMKFSSEIEESLLSGDITDYTNYVFKHKYYVIKVLKFSLEKMEIDFGIINNRALSEAR